MRDKSTGEVNSYEKKDSTVYIIDKHGVWPAPAGMSGAAARYFYVYTDSKMLTKGVEFTSYDIFMSDRTWNRAMSRRRICPSRILNFYKVLGDPRGINYLTAVSNVAQAYDTTAAINSDF